MAALAAPRAPPFSANRDPGPGLQGWGAPDLATQTQSPDRASGRGLGSARAASGPPLATEINRERVSSEVIGIRGWDYVGRFGHDGAI